LRAHEPELHAAGATIAAIGLGDIHYARRFQEETEITFPLLIDEERLAYEAANLQVANLFHLFLKDNFAARKKAQSAGHRQHKVGKNPFQLGASFVFAPGNKDIFTHVSQTFGDNASITEVLSALATLRATNEKRRNTE
jgi:peroxiredoxin